MQPSTLRVLTEANLGLALAALPAPMPLSTDPAVAQWVTSPFVRANRAGTLGAGTSYPMFIPASFGFTVSQCAIQVTTAVAASTATVNLYNDDGSRRASTTLLAASPTIDCSTTGVKTVTFATPPVLTAPGVWANITFTNTGIGINWAETFGVGTAVHTTVASILAAGPPLTPPENAAVATAYWVPRVALLRSA